MMPVYIGVPIAILGAAIGGYAAGGLMKLALRVIGHEGYVAESKEQRATRTYMEKAKQGMRD
jgi:hypothetical protein